MEGYVDAAFYDQATGKFSGACYRGPADDVEANAPAGTVPMPCADRPELKRLQDGELVDTIPDPPSPDYEWDAELRAHRLTKAARASRDARARILALETKQARAIREHAIGRGKKKDGSAMTAAELRKVLTDIDDEIEALRAVLGAGS